MRKRRIAYNEYVDERGNVRKSSNAAGYTIPAYRESSLSSAVADIGIAFLRLVWVVFKGLANGVGTMFKTGFRNLRREWGK